ncbi:hypothetical protein HHL21_12250 [Massilia sp. RP-1-19]|uniref:DUF3168 domain-containing protein n=1 Tax=Massilia polaris TaxID=2728846 RepID=A0A848HKZ3_9BURK|nr:hypothetical protein [Massilia polaris]NML61832.1 hypothetical protein [Massilia polaris]
MNAVVVMRSLLLAHAPVAAIVGSKVFAGSVPQGTALPAIGIKEISRPERITIANGGPATLVTARIQVTVYGTSYPQQKALLLAAKLGAGVHTGTIAGVDVRSVLRDTVGPDMGDESVPTFEQSRDFKVTYIEPN